MLISLIKQKAIRKNIILLLRSSFFAGFPEKEDRFGDGCSCFSKSLFSHALGFFGLLF